MISTTRDREYAKRYRAAHREEGLAYAKVYRAGRRQQLDEIKNVPCMDCGGSYPPYVMDFDHRDPTTKVSEVSHLLHSSMEKTIAEIEKCDLVCSNCHRIRTHTRKDS